MSNPIKKNPFAKNAVLFKDMSIDMKRPKVLILMMIFNGVVASTVAGFLLYIMTAGIVNEKIDYRILVYMLIAIVAEEAAILFTMMPALTANTISGERERQTLDVLLTTRMTPFEIVLGKYLSCVTLGFLLILSTVPFLSLVFIYGGMNFWQLFGLVLVEILEIAYIAVFGVFFSALTKRTVFAVILSYVMLGILVGGTLTAFGIVYGIGELINEAISDYYYRNVYSGMAAQNIPEFHLDIAIYLLLFNPVVTIFDCIGTFLGVEIDDVPFQGMKTIVDMNYITKGNITMVLWTPISLILQSGIVIGLLKLSAACLNPVKNTKKRERQFERANMKRIGVQDDPALDAVLLPSMGNMAQGMQQVPDGMMPAPGMQQAPAGMVPAPENMQPMPQNVMPQPASMQAGVANQMMPQAAPAPTTPVQEAAPVPPQVMFPTPTAAVQEMTAPTAAVQEMTAPTAAVQEMAAPTAVYQEAPLPQTDAQDVQQQ
ncbi:MAG: ABC transporter permease subunit [Lachnospiraceae bacterium]|nr:ABC transporter permease subunit [Lachnospiraceae bacterium]